jgi:hypothetical protein
MTLIGETVTCDMKHGVMALPGSLIGRPPKSEEFRFIEKAIDDRWLPESLWEIRH